MKDVMNNSDLEVGFDVPALPGMDEADIQTPSLVLDLDALERNIKKMGDYAKAHGMRHRVHGKMHKSVDVALMQVELGGACGVCCQKVSEAEVFARGGITDVLVSNQVRHPAKIDRLARLPLLGARASNSNGALLCSVERLGCVSVTERHRRSSCSCIQLCSFSSGMMMACPSPTSASSGRKYPKMSTNSRLCSSRPIRPRSPGTGVQSSSVDYAQTPQLATELSEPLPPPML